MDHAKTPSVVEDSVFEGISCYGSGSIAVGYSEGTFALLAETWTGSKWALMQDPASSGESSLWGVHCQNASSCTVVGDLGSSLVDTWNGQVWTMNVTPATGTLYGVSCTSAYCTAVGYTTNDGGALAMRN